MVMCAEVSLTVGKWIPASLCRNVFLFLSVSLIFTSLWFSTVKNMSWHISSVGMSSSMNICKTGGSFFAWEKKIIYQSSFTLFKFKNLPQIPPTPLLQLRYQPNVRVSGYSRSELNGSEIHTIPRKLFTAVQKWIWIVNYILKRLMGRECIGSGEWIWSAQ